MEAIHKTVVACTCAACLMLAVTITANAIYSQPKSRVADFIETCAWGGSADLRRTCSELAVRFSAALERGSNP